MNRPRKPTPARTFRERAQAVSRAYPGAVLGKEAAVHDLRVAARRMRVALRLLGAHPHGKKVRRADRRLKELADAAGVCRDLDVGRGHLERLAAATPRGDAGWKVLLLSYRGAWRRGRTRGGEALLDCDLAQLRRSLRELATGGLTDLTALAKRIDAVSRKRGHPLVGELLGLDAGSDPEVLHAIRRRVRRLRYAAEIAALLPRRRKEPHRAWRTVQTSLGEIQDRRVLAAWLDAWTSRVPTRPPDACAAAKAAADTLRAEADAIYRDLIEQGPAGLVRLGLAAMAGRPAQREVGGGVPFPKVHPTITLTSG
jgi:CHAD domain-containing protein